MHEQEERVTGLILAGGKSTRFGSDKASAPLLGKPMLQWVISALAGACDELVVVTAREQLLPNVEASVPIRVVVDLYDGLGPLAGLVAGFAAVATPLCFAVPCDAPLIWPALVTMLAGLSAEWDVVCPYVGGFMQPLAALYRVETCLPVFRDFVERDLLKVTAAFGPLRTRVVREDELRAVDPALESFLNANRPEGLEQVAAILAARQTA